MEDFQYYSYFVLAIIDTFHSKKYIISCHVDISRRYYCDMGDIYAYNVMFNLGTGMENVTHLKNWTLLPYGTFKCGPASQPLAHH